MKIYPNPSQGEFTIEIDEIEARELIVEVINSLGQSIYTRQFELRAASSIHSMNPGTLSPGIYYIRLVLDGKQKVVKWEVRS